MTSFQVVFTSTNWTLSGAQLTFTRPPKLKLVTGEGAAGWLSISQSATVFPRVPGNRFFLKNLFVNQFTRLFSGSSQGFKDS